MFKYLIFALVTGAFGANSTKQSSKGLKKKFGEYEQNEREYRQFFDKIVQLPFSMPMENYTLDIYLKQELEAIEYFDNNDYLQNIENMKYLTDICTLTIGNNPRAIKRVINYLSLIDKIIEAKDNNNPKESQQKALQFALIAIQVSYPQVYNLLAKEPNYLEWTDHLLEKVEDIDFENISFSLNKELIDEEWEQTLYKYIVLIKNKFLTSKVINILECFNLIRNFLKADFIKKEIEEMIQISSVTSAVTNKTKSKNIDFSEKWKMLDIEKFGFLTNRTTQISNSIKLVEGYINLSITLNEQSTVININYEKQRNAKYWDEFKNLDYDNFNDNKKRIVIKLKESYHNIDILKDILGLRIKEIKNKFNF